MQRIGKYMRIKIENEISAYIAEWIVSQRTKLTAAENKLLFSADEWNHGFEFQSRYIALRIQAGENSPVIRDVV